MGQDVNNWTRHFRTADGDPLCGERIQVNLALVSTAAAVTCKRCGARMNRVRAVDPRGLYVIGWSPTHQQPICGLTVHGSKTWASEDAFRFWYAKQPGSSNYGPAAAFMLERDVSGPPTAQPLMGMGGD